MGAGKVVLEGEQMDADKVVLEGEQMDADKVVLEVEQMGADKVVLEGEPSRVALAWNTPASSSRLHSEVTASNPVEARWLSQTDQAILRMVRE